MLYSRPCIPHLQNPFLPEVSSSPNDHLDSEMPAQMEPPVSLPELRAERPGPRAEVSRVGACGGMADSSQERAIRKAAD